MILIPVEGSENFNKLDMDGHLIICDGCKRPLEYAEGERYPLTCNCGRYAKHRGGCDRSEVHEGIGVQQRRGDVKFAQRLADGFRAGSME